MQQLETLRSCASQNFFNFHIWVTVLTNLHNQKIIATPLILAHQMEIDLINFDFE